LRPAVAGNVLAVDGEGYCFRHALIREALHDDLLPGEHTRLHTRFAEALERDLSILPAPRGAIELAHHWHSAHDSTWALVSAWHAAAVARKSTAYDEQLRMLSRVLELWDQVPDAAERIGCDRLDVLRQTATVAHLAGEYERAIALAGAALTDLDRDADPIKAAKLLRQRGLTRYDLGRPGFLDDLREAAALVPSDKPNRLRGQILETLSRMLHGRDVWSERFATSQLAKEIGHEVGDAKVEAHALINLAWAHFGFSEVEAQMEAFAEARRIAHRDEVAYNVLMRCAISESDALEGAGWHERAAQVARDGIEEAGLYGLARTSGTFLSINLAEPLVSLGRWDEALEVIEHALDLAPPAPYRASLQGFATDIALARGELDRAEELLGWSRSVLSRGTFRDQTVLPHLCREVRLLQARGQLDAAMQAAAQAMEERDLLESPRYSWPVLMTVASMLASVVPQPGRAAPPGQLGASLMARLRELGQELETDGDLQQAHRLTFTALMGPEQPLGDGAVDLAAWQFKAWDLAVSAWAALRQPYAEAQCLVGAAQAALASGDRQE
ncbi:helix-turn-helix transcriptional regulator, partial [Nonomuraea sp. NPDC049784]